MNRQRDSKGRFIRQTMPMVGAWKLERMQAQRDAWRQAFERERKNGAIAIMIWTSIAFIAGTIFFMLIAKK